MLILCCLSILILPIVSHESKPKTTLCDCCKHIMNKIKTQLLATQNKTYEGGMSSSEKNTLGEYENSELRLLEVLDGICSGTMDRTQCNGFVELYEDAIENWFFKLRHNDTPFFNHICVETSRACCMDHHFGKNCEVCPGWVDGVMCSGHGSCVGEGTRKGTGVCRCDSSFAGEKCENCDEEYFKGEDGGCSKCHMSCKGPCDDNTLEGCRGECKKGWEHGENGSCLNIDECARNMHNCNTSQFCIDLPGEFLCKECHESCHTCNGLGDTNCLYCRDGYEKSDDGKCVDVDECADDVHNCDSDSYCMNIQGGFTCMKCHKGCLHGCNSISLTGCKDCRSGYEKDESGKGCKDVDECLNEENPCAEGKYCINKEGSYKCKKCNKACDKCSGTGPHSCLSCAPDYEMVNGACLDPSNIKQVETSEEDDEL